MTPAPVVQQGVSSRGTSIAPTVLPIRGGQAHVPAARLVRIALAGAGEISRESLRAAIAVLEALAERGRAEAGEERYWWDRPISGSVTDLAARTGLLAVEVETGLDLLSRAGVLRGSLNEGWRISPDVLCEEPMLAALDWRRIRERVARVRGRLAPAAAVLREVIRLASGTGPEGPIWVRIAELMDASLYGRSAITHALSDLQRAGLLVRISEATRQGLQIRLGDLLWEERADRVPSPPLEPRPVETPEAEYVEEVMFGRHRIEVPPNVALRVVPAADGSSRIELGPLVIDTAPDGTQVASCGGLRITRRPRS